MNTRILCLLVVGAQLMSACSALVASPGGTGGAEEIVRSEAQRQSKPDVAGSAATELSAGNTAFALDLYQALRAREGNLFFSPYSISLALAMTYAGAAGQTEEQMAQVLHFALSQDSLHPAFNGLDQELAARGEGAEGKDEGGFRLNIVNAIWGQNDFSFLQSFLDVLAQNYGAGLRLVDFVTETEKTRQRINDWVSDQTEDRIKDLIPAGGIDSLTRLVLTNAIYFNAAWAYPFMEELTSDGDFQLLDGGSTTVPMMTQTETFRYGEGDGYQVVELPYDGLELSMLILLPDEGRFGEVEQGIDLKTLNDILGGLESTGVSLTMPKFTFESEVGLTETLAGMGMKDAFDSAVADFSGMTGGRDLFISNVFHKAFVDVDEAGTEAAAATAVVMTLTAIMESVTVKIDRPFIFMIRDNPTGTILFMGRVLNPGR